MKLISLLGILSTIAAAQTTLTLTGPPRVKQGAPVTLNLNLSGGTATGPVGLQWTLSPPAGVTVPAATTSLPAKQIACGTGNLLCLLYGMNNSLIAEGLVSSLTVQVPVSTGPGIVVFTLSNLVAADISAASMPITAGTPYSLTVLSRADIDGSGTVDIADVTGMAQQVTAGTCADDQNADGRCDLVDVLLVVLRAMGV